MQVEIELLTGHAHLAPVLAAWHHAEWGHLYDPEVWDHATAVAEFEAMAEPGSPDLTWVAFDGPARDHAAALGSVSLVATDDLAGFEHVTPWLASLFVREEARGRAVGARLVDALLAGAAALGHPTVHLFTSGQEAYYLARGWRVLDRVDVEGHAATVMARGTHPRSARRATCSHWCADPDTNGAYSYLRVGGTAAHRERLAREIAPGLWFAGEATSVEYPATIHGAWFSGERVAQQVLANGGSDGEAASVLVVGAGIAGMVAARRLREAGREVVVVESKAAPGGRIATDTSLGVPVPLGAAWLHGEVGHPVAPLVTWVAEEWTHRAMFVAGHGHLDDADVAAMAAGYAAVERAFTEADPSDPSDTVAAVVDRTVAELGLTPHVRAGLLSWLTAECESLYAAPMGDIAANGGFEAYGLPGDDRLITSSLQTVIDQLADGLDVRCDHAVRALVREADGWRTDTGIVAGQVIVTIPIGALRSDRIRFDPPLPIDVTDAITHIGAGPVTKVFATYDAAWWPPVRPMRLAGQDELTGVTDMTDLTGVPTLCGFAVGDAARRIEQLSEHELCELLDRVVAECGLRDWDR